MACARPKAEVMDAGGFWVWDCTRLGSDDPSSSDLTRS
jgi:hypothetical protein